MAGPEDPSRRSAAKQVVAQAGHAVVGLLYVAIDRIARVAIDTYFHRLRVVHRERFPRTGAVLLVANHPSAWADAGVLLGALGRKLHFVVQGEQFRPWPRGLLLRIFGALPVFARAGGDPVAAAMNAATFRRCEELFDRGEVVAVFPEGMSVTDRSLMPLRPGAARIAITHARRNGQAPFAVVAAGLWYSDRVAIRSDVAVNVGEPVTAAEIRRSFDGDFERAASRLTDRITRDIRALALGAARPRQAAVLASLEPIAARVVATPEEVRPGERLAASLDRLERADPGAYRSLARRALAQERARRALGTTHSLLAPPPRRAGRLRGAAAVAVRALGALPALAGALIHAVPAILTEVTTRWVASEPPQIAFARIAAGVIYFLAYYGFLARILVSVLGLSPWTAVAILAAVAALGACALAYGPRVLDRIGRLRLARIARRHPELVARARSEEAWLMGTVEAIMNRDPEIPDVDPAHPPVLELGARPSALPR